MFLRNNREITCFRAGRGSSLWFWILWALVRLLARFTPGEERAEPTRPCHAADTAVERTDCPLCSHGPSGRDGALPDMPNSHAGAGILSPRQNHAIHQSTQHRFDAPVPLDPPSETFPVSDVERTEPCWGLVQKPFPEHHPVRIRFAVHSTGNPTNRRRRRRRRNRGRLHDVLRLVIGGRVRIHNEWL